jgi:1,2-diacylglycerol 3-beta-galactosyltransferase
MAACDGIVTKAGPGTIAEALVRGLPILLSGFIPGQEEGNVPYVVDNGAGAFSTDPEEIARIVARWFGPDRDQLIKMSAQAKGMGNPQATQHIVEEVAQLLGMK